MHRLTDGTDSARIAWPHEFVKCSVGLTVAEIDMDSI